MYDAIGSCIYSGDKIDTRRRIGRSVVGLTSSFVFTRSPEDWKKSKDNQAAGQKLHKSTQKWGWLLISMLILLCDWWIRIRHTIIWFSWRKYSVRRLTSLDMYLACKFGIGTPKPTRLFVYTWKNIILLHFSVCMEFRMGILKSIRFACMAYNAAY